MEIVSVSVLPKVLSVDQLSCLEKDKEKEKISDRPARLNDFVLEEQHEFVTAVRK